MADGKERVTDAGAEATSKARGVAEAVTRKADDVMNGAHDLAGHLAEQSRAGYRQVAACAQNGLHQASATVRANPVLVVSAAFGVGVALGVMIGINSRPSRRNDFASHFHRPSWLS